MLIENLSLSWNLKIFARKHGLSYSSLSFLGGHLSTHCFDNSDTCPFFLNSFFMNNFCIATCFSLHNNCWRDSNKNLEHLFDENLWRIFLVFSPSVGVKHFWMNLDGMHVVAPTPSVVVHMRVVCTWSWF